MTIEMRVNGVIDQAIAAGKIVGTVVLVYRHGQPLVRRAAGHADREAGLPVRFDTIFRLASVTKPLVAAAALCQIDRGLYRRDTPVRDVLDWFHPPAPDGTPAEITVHHLLTHTSGLAYDPALEALPADLAINCGLSNTDLDFKSNFSRFNARGLNFAPGSQWAYSPSTDILGALVAAVDGGSLEQAVHHYVTGPLEMADTSFSVPDLARLATPYADGDDEAIRMPDPWMGSDPDGWSLKFSPGRLFNPRAYQSGGAGMVGTADDLLRFFETLRIGGGSLLPGDLVKAGLDNQIGHLAYDPGKRFGYFGAVITDPQKADVAYGKGSVQWGGVYGNSWFIDPGNGITMVLMSNTALEGCTGAFPGDIAAAIYG